MRSALSMWVLFLALACLTACSAGAPQRAYEPASPRMDSQGDVLSTGSVPPPEPAAQEMIVLAGTASSGGEMRAEAPAAKEMDMRPPPPPPPVAAPPSPQKPPAGAGDVTRGPVAQRQVSADKKKPAETGPAGEPAPAGEAAAVRAPMLIYTAGLTMQVVEVRPALARVEALARDLGGFVARRDDTTITIRVPVARFDEALAKVSALGDVVRRSVSTEDVTEEFLDLEVRLKNLRAVKIRLEHLLAKAETVEIAIAIERELGRVNGELDRIEARMKLLADLAAFSTITVTFQERPREVLNAAKPRLPIHWLDQLGLGRLLSL